MCVCLEVFASYLWAVFRDCVGCCRHHLACHYKTPQSVWLKQQTSFPPLCSLESWRSKSGRVQFLMWAWMRLPLPCVILWESRALGCLSLLTRQKQEPCRRKLEANCFFFQQHLQTSCAWAKPKATFGCRAVLYKSSGYRNLRLWWHHHIWVCIPWSSALRPTFLNEALI